MGDYTDSTSVAAFLNLPTFSVITTPTAETVESRIDEAEDRIDEETGHAWRSRTISNEYHECDQGYQNQGGIKIFLNHRAIKTLAHASGDKLEVWNGNSWVDWLNDSRTEGRNNDYWLRYEDGILYIRNWAVYPTGVRVTYRYGETTVPSDIKKAAILLVGIDIVSTDDRSVQLPEGSSQMTYLEKVEKWEETVAKIIEKHAEFRLPVR